MVLSACAASVSGCGNGGYAGNVVPAFASASRITIDSGQAVTLALTNAGNLPVQWSLAGTACTGETCGTLSAGSNTSVKFTAPPVASQVTVTVQASLTATKTTTTTTIIVNPAPKITGTPAAGTVGTAYSATLTASGGTGTLKWNALQGSLPAGLTFNTTTGIISGTPATVGTSSFTVSAIDQSDVPFTISATLQITISNGAVTTLSASGTPSAGTVGAAYTAVLKATGGTAPYTWSVVSGFLPAGLSLSTTGVISGTPTAAGTSTFTAQVKDAAGTTATLPLTITINASGSTLAITSSTLPDGTVGTTYTAAIGVSGGTAPYTCSLISGSLPAGLTFGAGCAVTGTPTIAGTSTPVIRVTDAANPAATVTGPVTVVIHPATAIITIASPPPATAGTPYTGLIPITGGTGPYTCTLVSGTAPGLTLTSDCHLTGTPTTGGAYPINIRVVDSSSPVNTKTGTITVTVNPGGTTLTLGMPPTATVGTPYTGIIPVTGGTGPYTCTVASGTLPSGLVLGTACTITGTPTTPGTTTVSITATDSASPVNTKTGPVTITVQPVATLTLTGSLPNATVTVAYTQTLHATGGVAPYTYAITAGNLPAGLSLSTAGVIGGTPTAVGASNFTVTATDSEATPQTASLPLVLLVVYQDSPYNNLLKGPYAFLFQGYDDVAAGVLAYQTSTIGSFTADGAGVLTAGEADSNHQTSNPSGNTVADASLVGTYTIGADGRGTIAISTLNTDGTVAGTVTVAVALKLPTAPATFASSGSLIEADNNALVGTKGSGSLLAQTASAFPTGLSGSYAFGLAGDTPCLPSCTIGLSAGPVASVGQFTAIGGTLNGTGDANIASTNYPTSTLAGSYAAADGNGRVQFSLTASKLAATTAYPTDFALYMVDASHAFVMSTNKHSSYILQAGTTTLQTQTTFSNASLNAPYVGYENAPVNPGLVGTTLGNVLNISSATVFRGTGNNNGTCTTTNVDVGGLTGLVSSLTGLGSNSGLLNALLGTYQSLGNSTCTVTSNGRTVLNYANPSTLLSVTLGLLGLGNQPPPARVVYLTAPNAGYFLETGYAGLGNLEAQTGGPFSIASLHGSYVYGSVPASSLATINGTGSFTADGAGNATATIDQNVGVGTINVLQLGTHSTTTYSLTDAAAGRYLLGGSRVVYAITPGRYVLLETNPLSTSPYIALLF